LNNNKILRDLIEKKSLVPLVYLEEDDVITDIDPTPVKSIDFIKQKLNSNA